MQTLREHQRTSSWLVQHPCSAEDQAAMAAGWTLPLGIFGIQDHGADLGLGHDLVVDLGLAVEPPGAPATADLSHVVE